MSLILRTCVEVGSRKVAMEMVSSYSRFVLEEMETSSWNGGWLIMPSVVEQTLSVFGSGDRRPHLSYSSRVMLAGQRIVRKPNQVFE